MKEIFFISFEQYPNNNLITMLNNEVVEEQFYMDQITPSQKKRLRRWHSVGAKWNLVKHKGEIATF